MQIKKLEETVVGTLFERGSRGVALTRRGGELIVNARRIVSLQERDGCRDDGPALDGPCGSASGRIWRTILSRALAPSPSDTRWWR